MAANFGMVPFLPAAVNLHNGGALMTFGSLQLIFAVGLIINDAIAFATTSVHAVAYTAAGSGFYLGIYYIITGSLGIAAGVPLRKGTPPTSRKCLLITTMVMSILATIFSCVVFIIFAVLLSNFSSGYLLYNYYSRCSIANPDVTWHTWCHFFYWQKGYGHLGSNLLFELIVFIASLGSCIAAGVNCCKLPGKGTNMQVVYTQGGQPGYYPGGQQVVYNQTMPGGQQMVYNQTLPGQHVYFVPPQDQQAPLAAPPGYSEPAQPVANPEENPAAQK